MSQEDALQESARPNPAETAAAETAQTEPTPIEQLGQQLADVARKAEENWERFVRTQAELENLRRRSEKDVQNAHKYALEKFAKELLSVVDSLELGLQAVTGDTSEVQKLREGMELTLKQLLTAFEKFEVRTIDPTGEKFNPELHQAMALQPTETAEPNTVVKVFQKGYCLHDRLLRPAMVVIAQAVATPTQVGEQA
jgi:molecular chaperone GrpE